MRLIPCLTVTRLRAPKWTSRDLGVFVPPKKEWSWPRRSIVSEKRSSRGVRFSVSAVLAPTKRWAFYGKQPKTADCCSCFFLLMTPSIHSFILWSIFHCVCLILMFFHGRRLSSTRGDQREVWQQLHHSSKFHLCHTQVFNVYFSKMKGF